MSTPTDIGAKMELDQKARLLAQTVFDRPLVLEAGAGTGKTATLVARIVSWCLGPGWDRTLERITTHTENPPEADRIAALCLSRIVAITFTEAAAAEMASRVGDAMAEIEQGNIPIGLEPTVLPADLAARLERARAYLGNLDHMVVTTIHAYCRRLLAAFPLEIGLDPRFIVDADGNILMEVVRETLEKELVTAYSEDGNEHFLGLARAGYGPRELEQTLIRLAENGIRPETLNADPLSPEKITALRDRLSDSVRMVISLVRPCLEKAKRLKTGRNVLSALGGLFVRLESMGGTLGELIQLHEQAKIDLPPNLIDHIQKWATRKDLSATEAEITEPVGTSLCNEAQALDIRLRHLLSLDVPLLTHARLALAPLVQTVRTEMRRRGAETFNALLQDARTLLTGHDSVCDQVRQKIDQLLVDEFQDTDLLQCEIIEKLALTEDAEHRPGLFLVGDPKQSIFGWRSADLRAYDHFVRKVTETSGEVHALTTNFRSAPPILAEVKRVMPGIMKAETGVQPMFQELLACPQRQEDPGFLTDDHSPIEYWVTADWNEIREKINVAPFSTRASEIEALALAKDLRALRDEQGVEWSDIGVLFRAATDTEPYLGAFREHGIPYYVERDTNFYRRREIIDICAVVRCVLDPNDHLALVTYLRSAMVGVPDAAWIPLWTRKFPEKITELRGRSLKKLEELRELVCEVASSLPKTIPGLDRIEGWEHNLLRGAESLAILREEFHRRPADEFVELMRRLLLVESTESGRYLGPYRLANLDRFFRNLIETLNTNKGAAQAVLRLLRTGVSQAREFEEGRPNDAVMDAVQVMTIHKAKGLDFEHVYIMQTHRAPISRDSGQTLVPEDGGEEYQLFGAATPGFDLVRERQAEVEAAERVRTLYVAMTRAKRRMVLCGLWLKTNTTLTTHAANCHMDLFYAANRIPESLSMALAKENHYRDHDQVLWRLPARQEPLHPSRLFPASDAGLPAVAEVRRASTLLTTRRRQARSRMERPYRGPVSAVAHEELEKQKAAPRQKTEANPEHGQTRSMSMAIGTALHRVFENLDLAHDLPEAFSLQGARIDQYLRPTNLAPAEHRKAKEKTQLLLRKIEEGPLPARMAEIRDHILARELPLIAPPVPDHGPTGFLMGAIDLLYRDPETGDLVVADYKTDFIESDESLDQKVEIYSKQLSVYARSIADALGLDRPPRIEMWFLSAGRIEAGHIG